MSTFQVSPSMVRRNDVSLQDSSSALSPMVQILLAWQQALKCPRFWQLLHVASQAGFMIWTSATPVVFSAKRVGYLFSTIPGPHLFLKGLRHL